MLRKWEAWVPLPPQPEGPKPTSPTSHESAPTTRLEATLGGGSSSAPACFETAPAPPQRGISGSGGRGRVGGERGIACPTPKPRSGGSRHQGAGSPGLPPRSPDVCHPREVCTLTEGYGIQLPPLSLAPRLKERIPARWVERVFPLQAPQASFSPEGPFLRGSRQAPPLALSHVCHLLEPELPRCCVRGHQVWPPGPTEPLKM